METFLKWSTKMILTAAQAQELGEALLDASNNLTNKNTAQSVILLNDKAISVPTGDHVDDWPTVAYVK
jgi:hypothetical protein